MVTNIFDLVELLPKLNVTDDPELNRFAEEARQTLCTYTAHDLKKHELLRAATATEAAGLVERMDEAIRNREAEQAEQSLASVQGIFDHMSAYMEAPLAA
jgi:threonine synthase